MTALFTDAELRPVDRSTLERFAACPAQACYVEQNSPPAGLAAAVGQEAHQAISRTIQAYIESSEVTGPQSFRERFESETRCARPDVQPEVIRVLRGVWWKLSEYIAGNIAPDNILRFDGGLGGRSGQLSWPVEDLGVVLTSEVDLLHATRSRELLCECDWKTGWGHYDEQDVFDSFQFQMHAYLVLRNYESVEALRVIVWNTRNGSRSRPVEFARSDLASIETRIRSAVGHYLTYSGKPYELAETWPATEKCRICAAAANCPVADLATQECDRDPVQFVEKMIAVSARLDAMSAEATAYCDKTGKSIVTPSGTCFGRDKPRAERKAAAVLYERKNAE